MHVSATTCQPQRVKESRSQHETAAKNLGSIGNVSRKTADKPRGKSDLALRVYFARKALEEKRGTPISQQRLADAGGINRLLVQNIEADRGKATGKVAREGLARAFGVPIERLSAYLSGAYGKPTRDAARHFVDGLAPPGEQRVPTPGVAAAARILELPADLLVACLDSPGEVRDKMRFDTMPEPARRAAWAVMHVVGCTIEEAFRAAWEAVADASHPEGLEAQDWFGRIKDRVRPRPTSGTRPSERSLKISG